MEDNNFWSKNKDNFQDFSKKINDKADEVNIVEDLKVSLMKTIEQSSKSLNNVIKNLESSIKDNEIKKESKELIEGLNIQLKNIILESQEKLGKIFDVINHEEE